jgi:hypothetical protein
MVSGVTKIKKSFNETVEQKLKDSPADISFFAVIFLGLQR